MLLKSADSKDGVLAELGGLVSSASQVQREHIKREIQNIQAGMKGEREAAYHIDFDYEKAKNSVVLHDLRLEIGGRVAQIDHLLITRLLDCFVFESKHFHCGLKITEEGEFLRWNGYQKRFEGMASPLAQNDRHVEVLRDAFKEIEMPIRLGLRLTPTFHPYVLISANARIDRPKIFDTSRIIKADIVKQTINEFVDKAGFLATASSLAKLIDRETLQSIGTRLASMHKPLKTDWSRHFASKSTDNLKPTPPPAAMKREHQENGPVCKHCEGISGSILYGKYGYYLKCSACAGNTSIRVECDQAGHKARVRKDGRTFYRECEACASSSVYFVNPE